MKEYMLAILLEQKAAGETFGRWPLHITVVPWFRLDKPLTGLIADFQREMSSRQSFRLHVGLKQQWGHHTVHLVENPALRSLHRALISLVKEHGTITAQLLEYKPHITQKTYATVQEGFSLAANQVYLVEAPKTNPLTRLKTVMAIGEFR